jgi:hypothetical protein
VRDELTVNVLYVRAVIALALPALADVVVPAWLLSFSAGGIDIGAARFVGVPLLGAGCWLLLDSVFVRFAHEGRGTLAPIVPPRFVSQSSPTCWGIAHGPTHRYGASGRPAQAVNSRCGAPASTITSTPATSTWSPPADDRNHRCGRAALKGRGRD